jgi:Alternative complex III, ActD subunit
MSTTTIISSFVDDTQCAHAIEDLRAAQVGDFNTFSPIPSHRIEHAIGRKKSPVRWLVMTGGIAGFLTGLAITIGTSYEWRLNAGGKPIISWPPFLVISFELMVLFGGISGFLGTLGLSGVPAIESAPGYAGRFGEDRFGIVVRCEEAEAERVESMLKEAGAEEVVREDGAQPQ